jgi:hypothetical protein
MHFVEKLCAKFNRDNSAGLALGVYFRFVLVGYYAGIDSERGLASRPTR